MEAFSDPPHASLFPEEKEAIARAVEKRRNEFTTARACAREALAQLGIAPGPIPRGPDGAPRWPSGIAGSITHCAGYRACAVARTSEVASLGIDAEPNEATPDGVAKTITDEAERRHLAALPASSSASSASASWPGVHWDRLLFSAKESVYKTWFPLTGRWLGFEDARISIDPERETFTARLQVPGPVVGGVRRDSFTGRWIAREGLLVTAIVIPA